MKSSNILNQCGQGLTEYVILLMLVALASLVASQTFGRTIQKKIRAANHAIDSNIVVDEIMR